MCITDKYTEWLFRNNVIFVVGKMFFFVQNKNKSKLVIVLR